jgi:hypothetical protein
MQLVALFSNLVPFGRGWLSLASCAQCWGKRRHTLRSGKKTLFGILILCGLLLSSLIVITIVPRPAITNPSLIPPPNLLFSLVKTEILKQALVNCHALWGMVVNADGDGIRVEMDLSP